MSHLVDCHFVLLKLVSETNEVLGAMVGSYFGTQVIILCFETYFLVDVGFSRGWLTSYAFLILLQTMLIMVMVALTASSVHEEATEGFEAIRGALRNQHSIEEDRMVRLIHFIHRT